jgi:hypothetical protein
MQLISRGGELYFEIAVPYRSVVWRADPADGQRIMPTDTSKRDQHRGPLPLHIDQPRFGSQQRDFHVRMVHPVHSRFEHRSLKDQSGLPELGRGDGYWYCVVSGR